MKILYITYGQTPDYLSDSILHGFKELGHEIHEISDCWYLYKKNKSTNWKIKIPNEGKSYGFGYSLHGTLDDNLNSFGKYNLEELFEEKYYDFVFFAKAQSLLYCLDEVTKVYNKNQIVFFDGCDFSNINYNLLELGTLFKRECDTNNENVFPISFAYPECKVLSKVKLKEKRQALIIPGELSTYIYGVDDEDKYLNDYAISYFGITFKKAGWECMRHHEIMSQGCIPYFKGIENCPPRVLFNYPKKEILETNKLFESNDLTEEILNEKCEFYLNYCKNNLTTKHLANYILNIINK